jgi:SAM-dependent methyltransferase
MHPEAFAYVATASRDWTGKKVVEFGSRDVNGSVRGLFTGADYTGIDTAPGPGVDVVADAATWVGKNFDAVVCCEVLEHTPKGAAIVAAAGKSLKKGGVLIVTCATTGRAPHSAVDGAAVRPGEFYRNVTRSTFEKWLAAAKFTSWDGHDPRR